MARNYIHFDVTLGNDDIAHLIKIICGRNVFHGKHPKVKDFFVRCIGIISTCDNINDFTTLLTSVFIVAYSEYDGKDIDGNDVICAEKKSYLFERIKSFTFTDDDNNRKYDYLDNFEKSENLIFFINNIWEQAEQTAKQIVETDDYNVFYCPELVRNLTNLAKHFPIWTGVMTQYFPNSSNVATTCRCEAYFKDLKHSDLGSNYEPTRADKFITRHIRSIESICKLECAATKHANEKIALLQNEIKKSEKRKVHSTEDELEESTDDVDEYVHLKEQENWKDLNAEACKKSNKKNELEDVQISIHDKVPDDFVQESFNRIKNKPRRKYLKRARICLTYDRPLRKRKDQEVR